MPGEAPMTLLTCCRQAAMTAHPVTWALRFALMKPPSQKTTNLKTNRLPF